MLKKRSLPKSDLRLGLMQPLIFDISLELKVNLFSYIKKNFFVGLSPIRVTGSILVQDQHAWAPFSLLQP